MSKSFKDRLIQALIDNKLIAEKDLEAARTLQSKEGGSLGRILVKEGIISENDLMSIMSR